jgi:hypothetical protein
MTESVNERGSTSSDIGEVEIAIDDNELEDQRLRFILNYLNIIYGTTPTGFKKGVKFDFDRFWIKFVLFFQLFLIMKSIVNISNHFLINLIVSSFSFLKILIH